MAYNSVDIPFSFIFFYRCHIWWHQHFKTYVVQLATEAWRGVTNEKCALCSINCPCFYLTVEMGAAGVLFWWLEQAFRLLWMQHDDVQPRILFLTLLIAQRCAECRMVVGTVRVILLTYQSVVSPTFSLKQLLCANASPPPLPPSSPSLIFLL